MEVTPIVSGQRKRRPFQKSRFGCRNCKLRKIKCDELKPQCQKCRDYSVLCNFIPGTSELQVSTSAGFLMETTEYDNQLGSKVTIPKTFTPRIICSDGSTSFEMDTQCMTRLERFRMATLSPFVEELKTVWQHQVPEIAFSNPYLMHTIISLAAAHERYRATPTNMKQSRSETHHYAQGVLLFNKKLSCAIDPSDRDPLWATAALLSFMSIASFDATTPEESWPLRPLNRSDLGWFYINNGPNIIWNLVEPLRPGSIFQSMASEYTKMYFELPSVGIEGVSSAVAELCGITASCTEESSPYFVAAHVISRLQSIRFGEVGGIQMVMFICQLGVPFRQLLSEKDPVALILLVLWYEQVVGVLWWVENRARMETRAIRLYLERFHPGDLRPQQYLLN